MKKDTEEGRGGMKEERMGVCKGVNQENGEKKE